MLKKKYEKDGQIVYQSTSRDNEPLDAVGDSRKKRVARLVQTPRGWNDDDNLFPFTSADRLEDLSHHFQQFG